MHKNAVDVLKDLHIFDRTRTASMSLPLPEYFHSALTTPRLSVIADLLLMEVSSTGSDMKSDVDDGYTRGCVLFGRQKNRLKFVALSKEYPWFTLLNGANEFVFAIGGIPCRFSTDDPLNPSKPAVTQVSQYQAGFFEEVEGDAPCRFCFIVDMGHGDSDPRVVFQGQDPTGKLLCQWVSDSVRSVYVPSAHVPEAKEIRKPQIGPKRQSDSGAEQQLGT
jgi:hypothetical protein